MTLRRYLRRLWQRLGWVFPLGLVACHGSVPAKGPCSSEMLAAISARFTAAVLAACDHSKPLAQCPSYEPLRKQNEAELQVWQSCSTN